MWQLPIDSEMEQRYGLPSATKLQELKNAVFRRHVASTLDAVTWAQYEKAPTDYLRSLYPGVYLYGPRHEATEKFGNALLEAYRAHGIKVLTSLPHLSIVSGEESDYFANLLAAEFRPNTASRVDFAEAFTDTIFKITEERGEELTETEAEIATYETADTLEMTLALDLIPQTQYFTDYLRQYHTYRQRWDLP